MLRAHLGELVPARNGRTVRERLERFRKQTRLEVCVGRLKNLQFIIHRVCEPVAIPLLPHRVHEFTEGVAKRKHLGRLSVDERPTELVLNALILGNHRIVERLLDEDGSELAVSHRTILTVLWILMAAMRNPLLLLGDADRCEAYRVYDLLSRRLEIGDDVLHYRAVVSIFYLRYQ